MTEMDAKTAIEYMRSIRRTPTNWIVEYEAIDKAIEALEKQIKEESDVGMFCPNCCIGVHKHIFAKKVLLVKFCPFCGEPLDWSDEQ